MTRLSSVPVAVSMADADILTTASWYFHRTARELDATMPGWGDGNREAASMAEALAARIRAALIRPSTGEGERE